MLTMNFIRLPLCATLAMGLLFASPAGAQTQNGTKSIQAGGDQTLVLPPTTPSSGQPSTEAPGVPGQNAPEPDIGSDNAPLPADLPAPEDNGPRPYLGISVLYAVSTRDGQKVSGLEVMDVDADSPASRAGLKSRTPMTTIGAS